MNYMFNVTVKNKYFGGGVQLPAGLSVRVAHDSITSPLYSTSGKQRIVEAFKMQCGIDLSRCVNCVSTLYMSAERI